MSEIAVHSEVTPEQFVEPNDVILVIGAGGRMANQLYLPRMSELGISDDHFVLVDNNRERLEAIHGEYPDASAFDDTDAALDTLHEQGKNISAVIITSNTAAHVDNLRSIVAASHEGKLDLSAVKIWSEKPVAPPELFAEVQKLKEEAPELELSVGYILRFSGAAHALNKKIEDDGLTINSIYWKYGKNRENDTRPTQGVIADEIVHPISVTDMIMMSAFGERLGVVDVSAAQLQYRDFVNREVQDKARAANAVFPEQPVSDALVHMAYEVTGAGSVREIPVVMDTSFKFDQQHRYVAVSVTDRDGKHQSLTLDFDSKETDANGNDTQADIVRLDGEEIYRWDGNKAAEQMRAFLAGEREKLVQLEGETGFQGIIDKIGTVAARNADITAEQ